MGLDLKHSTSEELYIYEWPSENNVSVVGGCSFGKLLGPPGTPLIQAQNFQ